MRILTNIRPAERVVEWRPISERVALLRFKLKKKSLALVQVYAPNIELEYAPFLDKVLDVLEGILETGSVVLIRDFKAHVGKDAQTWKGLIGKNGDSDSNTQDRLLLDFCASEGLSITNVFPSQRHPQIHLVHVGRFGDPKITDRLSCRIRQFKEKCNGCVHENRSRAVDRSPPSLVQIATGFVKSNAKD